MLMLLSTEKNTCFLPGKILPRNMGKNHKKEKVVVEFSLQNHDQLILLTSKRMRICLPNLQQFIHNFDPIVFYIFSYSLRVILFLDRNNQLLHPHRVLSYIVVYKEEIPVLQQICIHLMWHLSVSPLHKHNEKLNLFYKYLVLN